MCFHYILNPPRTGLSWKVLEIKFALKGTGETLKGLEKSLNFAIYRCINTVFGDLNQYKIMVPPFGAANKGTTILYQGPSWPRILAPCRKIREK